MLETTKQLCRNSAIHLAIACEDFVQAHPEQPRLAAAACAKSMIVGGITWMALLLNPTISKEAADAVTKDVLDLLNERFRNA